MTTISRVDVWLTVLLTVAVSAGAAAAQVAVDRVLQRVGTHVVTELDVRRARLLKLIATEPVTDADIQRELENHWLIASEVSRFNPAAPDAEAVANERSQWEARLGPGADIPALLTRAGTTEAELETWFQDEARIRRHLDRLFGRVPPADRPAAIAAWIRGLRDRAGLR